MRVPMTLRDFLARSDLLAYADAFEAEQITLADLADLTDDELRTTVGMASFPHRKRLRAAVAEPSRSSGAEPADPLSGATRVLPAAPPSPLDPLPGATRVLPTGSTPTGPSLAGPTRMAGSSGPTPSAPSRMGGPAPALPATLGSYRVLGLLGAGGMGTVVRARHIDEGWATTQGGDVAIKLIHPHLAEDATFRARFLKEAELGRRVQHPSLVPTWDVVLEAGWLGTVMSFVSGESLSTRIRPGGAPVEEVIALLTPVGEAIDYLHSQGIVHRDLKPANIIVRSDGRPVVLDLGIAKDALATDNYTRTATAMGTSAWMAPEQADAKHVDGAADRYALGLIAYALLAGRLPWKENTSENRVLAMKLYGQLEGLDAVRGGLPEHVVAAVMRMASLEAGERFPSCVAFVEELARVAEGMRALAALRVELAEQARAASARTNEERLRRLRDELFDQVSVRSAVSSGPRAGETWQSPTLGTFRGIPAGTFRMGAGTGQHEVTLTRGFWLMDHPVTQREWTSIMGSNPSWFQGGVPPEAPAKVLSFWNSLVGSEPAPKPAEALPGGPDHPVEQVSWTAAVAFAEKVSARDGVRHRLPTEAEWEYAARGGQDHRYSGSDDADAVAWHRGNSGGSTHPVGQKAANGYGLRDMSGNVREWVADRHGAYPSGSATDPTGPAAGSHRVVRGGGWSDYAGSAAVAYRNDGSPDGASSSFGFRLLRSIS